MSDYGKFSTTQREIEMQKTDDEWRAMNRREQKWRRDQFIAEAISWVIALLVISLAGYGIMEVMRHVWVG